MDIFFTNGAAIPSLRKTGTIVEVDHPKRGKYLTVGMPIKLSDSPADVQRSPLLGEHTDEIMKMLGFGDNEIKTVGGLNSTRRTPEQTAIARF